MTVSNVEYNRLWWHSRRGMLELDLVLLPFLENQFRQLDQADQHAYRDLLLQEDQDLYRWLIGCEKATDARLQNIVTLIRKAANQSS